MCLESHSTADAVLSKGVYYERLFYQRLRSILPFLVGNESREKKKVATSYADKKSKVEWNFYQIEIGSVGAKTSKY